MNKKHYHDYYIFVIHRLYQHIYLHISSLSTSLSLFTLVRHVYVSVFYVFYLYNPEFYKHSLTSAVVVVVVSRIFVLVFSLFFYILHLYVVCVYHLYLNIVFFFLLFVLVFCSPISIVYCIS